MLGACERTFRRYVDRYEDEGLEGLTDKRLGQVSARRAPVDEVVRGAAFDLLLRWLELVVRLHPEVREDVVDVATTVGRLDRGIKEERGRVTASFRKLAEHMRRTVTQARGLAGERRSGSSPTSTSSEAATCPSATRAPT